MLLLTGHGLVRKAVTVWRLTFVGLDVRRHLPRRHISQIFGRGLTEI